MNVNDAVDQLVWPSNPAGGETMLNTLALRLARKWAVVLIVKKEKSLNVGLCDNSLVTKFQSKDRTSPRAAIA